MKNNKFLFILVVISILFFYSGQKLCFAQKDGDDVVIGKYKMIHSHVLDEDRLLLIHLLREYGDTQLSYPVLYVLYGQDINNYFAEAVIITEMLGSTGEIPPVIIVEEESPRIPRRGRAEMIRKVYELNPLSCPKCQGEMRVIAFLTDYAVIDRIIKHFKLTFHAERPPPPQSVQQELLIAAEEHGEYF